MSERVLDLGIGHGGEYLKQNNFLRVGLDISLDTLSVWAWKGKPSSVHLVAANAETTVFSLPFQEKSFPVAECYFPHNELLVAFCVYELGLWEELNRVLEPEGIVKVVLDAPFGGQGNEYHGDHSLISFPEEQIASASERATFKLQKIEKLSKKEIDAIGSDFSSLGYNPFVNVYQVISKKSR